MSRYVDADALSAELAAKCYELDHTGRQDEGTGCGIAKEIVDNAPRSLLEAYTKMMSEEKPQ